MGRSERAKSVVSKEMLLAAAKEASKSQREQMKKWEKFEALSKEEKLRHYSSVYLKAGYSPERVEKIIDGLSKSSFYEDNPNER